MALTPPVPQHPASETPDHVTHVCSYCGGHLGPDARSSSQATSPSAQQFCCYGCRWLGENRPITSAAPAQPTAANSAASSNPWFKVGLGTVFASQAMVLGLAINLSPPQGTARFLLHLLLLLSAAITLAVLGPPLLRASWDCACRRRIGVELLFLSGLIGAFGASVWSSITGFGAVYYEIVAVLLTVYTLGKTLTAHVRARALSESLKLRETFANARIANPDGSQRFVDIHQLHIGDLAYIRAGEPIPIDGHILEGQAFVQETPLTGEPHPVVRRPGDFVLAGSYSVDGDLTVRVDSRGHTRRLDALLQAMDSARDDLAGIESQARADRLAAWFLPLVLGTSVATFLFWGSKGLWMPGLFHALAVLLVACPCALGLATPLAVWNTLASLGARGFVVRKPAHLERLATLRAIAFDKTGTLSEEHASLIDFATNGTPSLRRQWLAWLSEIQSHSPHPIGRAFSTFVPESSTPTPTRPLKRVSVKSHPGCGIEAWIETNDAAEHRLRIGNADWIRDHPNQTQLQQAVRALPSDQLVFVELDGVLIGIGAIRERLRDSSQSALHELQALGIAIEVLTGDSADRAKSLLGMEPSAHQDKPSSLSIQARLSPTDKAERLNHLRHLHGATGFVGDGINDGPALQHSDFGIALDSGTPLATATADAVLYGGDLRELPRAIRTARAMHRSIQGNLWFAAAYNLIGMALAATGHLHPVAAALLMVGSSSIVAWRSLRPSDSCAPASTPPAQARKLPPALLSAGWSASFALQWPLLSALGSLKNSTQLVLALPLLAASACAWFFTRQESQRTTKPNLLHETFRMHLAMLGPGNLGMLIGWWIDAGFGPVMRDGVCLCCQSHHYFQLGARIPWMHVGMLALSVPFMWRDFPRIPFLGGRIGAAILTSAAMVAGMSAGADLLLKSFRPMHPHQFLIAYVGMSGGMLLAMAFVCAGLKSLAVAHGASQKGSNQ